MMAVEQTHGYRISFELTKPNQSNQALLVPSSTFSVSSGFEALLIGRKAQLI